MRCSIAGEVPRFRSEADTRLHHFPRECRDKRPAHGCCPAASAGGPWRACWRRPVGGNVEAVIDLGVVSLACLRYLGQQGTSRCSDDGACVAHVLGVARACEHRVLSWLAPSSLSSLGLLPRVEAKAPQCCMGAGGLAYGAVHPCWMRLRSLPLPSCSATSRLVACLLDNVVIIPTMRTHHRTNREEANPASTRQRPRSLPH